MPTTSSKTDFQDIIEPFVEHENKKRKAENINLSRTDSTHVESGKKIKWDNTHFSDEAAASAIVPVSQNDPQSSIITDENRKNVPKPDRIPREKCKYGTQCYR